MIQEILVASYKPVQPANGKQLLPNSIDFLDIQGINGHHVQKRSLLKYYCSARLEGSGVWGLGAWGPGV